MLRPGIARCVVEDDVCVLYHCMDNSRELYGAPLTLLNSISMTACASKAASLPQGRWRICLTLARTMRTRWGLHKHFIKKAFLVIDDDAVTQGAGALDEQEGEGARAGKGGRCLRRQRDPF